jgi:hypothetical protein
VVLVHTAISLEFRAWVRKALIKVMRGFLSTGTEAVHGAKCAVAWNQVQRPLVDGLGIHALEKMGTMLQLRWMWKQKQASDSTLHCIAVTTAPQWHSSDHPCDVM